MFHALAALVILVANDPAPKALDPAAAGCSDRTRDAFKSIERYPDIAGCSGGFARPGVLIARPPACHRRAGNDSANPNGKGCNVADLCAEGWHVCATAGEVAARASDGCKGVFDCTPGSFFVTRQSGPGYNLCATGTKRCPPNTERVECMQTPEMRNDLFGCGDVGFPAHASCAPLNFSSGNFCGALRRPWKCAGGSGEAVTVTKRGPEMGGVLCCRDRGTP